MTDKIIVEFWNKSSSCDPNDPNDLDVYLQISDISRQDKLVNRFEIIIPMKEIIIRYHEYLSKDEFKSYKANTEEGFTRIYLAKIITEEYYRLYEEQGLSKDTGWIPIDRLMLHSLVQTESILFTACVDA